MNREQRSTPRAGLLINNTVGTGNNDPFLYVVDQNSFESRRSLLAEGHLPTGVGKQRNGSKFSFSQEDIEAYEYIQEKSQFDIQHHFRSMKWTDDDHEKASMFSMDETVSIH